MKVIITFLFILISNASLAKDLTGTYLLCKYAQNPYVGVQQHFGLYFKDDQTVNQLSYRSHNRNEGLNVDDSYSYNVNGEVIELSGGFFSHDPFLRESSKFLDRKTLNFYITDGTKHITDENKQPFLVSQCWLSTNPDVLKVLIKEFKLQQLKDFKKDLDSGYQL